MNNRTALSSATEKTAAFRVILTIAGLGAHYGGPSRSTWALAQALAENGMRVDLVTCDEGEHPATAMPAIGSPRLHLLPTACRKTQWLARANAFFGLVKSLIRDGVPTVLHDTGLWLPNNHACAAAAAKLDVPLVISPRGMLSEWALHFRSLKKRLAWMIYQRHDLATAQVLHATSRAEASDFRRLGLRQPIAVIPNGVSLPADPDLPSPIASCNASTAHARKTVLFLSRLHPKKGLLELVEAWRRFRPQGWRVVVAGGGGSHYRAQVEHALNQTGLAEQFEFLGEITDDAKWSLYRAADLFVLPSKSENFGLVIAEALACGVPVITTQQTPWNELVQHQCGWWVEQGVEPLARALREAMALTVQQRREMGARGSLLVRSKFAWPSVAQQMKSTYEWLLGQAQRPECVEGGSLGSARTGS